MPTDEDQDRDVPSELRFAAIEIGDSAALGGDVRVEIAPRATVPVGKNGVGKSAILERIHEGLCKAIGMAEDAQLDPGRLTCDIPYGTTRTIRYQSSWQLQESADRANDNVIDIPRASRSDESCIFIESGELVWRVEDGHVVRDDGIEMEIPPGRGLLSWSWESPAKKLGTFPELVAPLFKLFVSVERIASGVPRDARRELVLPYPRTRPLDVRYLHDEGTLGDYVYSGALDG